MNSFLDKVVKNTLTPESTYKQRGMEPNFCLMSQRYEKNLVWHTYTTLLTQIKFINFI